MITKVKKKNIKNRRQRPIGYDGRGFIRTINCGQFPMNVVVIMGYKIDAAIKAFKGSEYGQGLRWMRDNKGLVDNQDCALYTTVDNKHLFYIIMPSWNNRDWDFIKLAHECLHACQFVLPLFLERDKEHECEAYLHTHLMSQILEIIRSEK
jgi:hypothetical protein